MERHLKERLIGATILLLLVVLLVPEFLSGPKSPPSPPTATLPVPTHTYTVDLNDPTRATLQEPATAAPAASMPPAATPAPTEAPAQPQAEVETASNAPTMSPGLAEASSTASGPAYGTEPPPSSKGSWSVQLGSFASKANADKLVQVLAAKGYTVSLSTIGAGSRARYRVRIGQLTDREAALRMIAKLKSQGRVATLVPPV
jgi:DedD protein